MWNDTDTRAALLKAAMDEVNPEIRLRGINGLFNLTVSEANRTAMWNDTDTRAAFLNAAMDEANPEIRLQGMKGLHNLTISEANMKAMWNDKDTHAALLRAAMDEANPEIRQWGMKGLKNLTGRKWTKMEVKQACDRVESARKTQLGKRKRAPALHARASSEASGSNDLERTETKTELLNHDHERTDTKLIAALIENDWQFSENHGDAANATLGVNDEIFCFLEFDNTEKGKWKNFGIKNLNSETKTLTCCAQGCEPIVIPLASAVYFDQFAELVRMPATGTEPTHFIAHCESKDRIFRNQQNLKTSRAKYDPGENGRKEALRMRMASLSKQSKYNYQHTRQNRAQRCCSIYLEDCTAGYTRILLSDKHEAGSAETAHNSDELYVPNLDPFVCFEIKRQHEHVHVFAASFGNLLKVLRPQSNESQKINPPVENITSIWADYCCTADNLVIPKQDLTFVFQTLVTRTNPSLYLGVTFATRGGVHTRAGDPERAQGKKRGRAQQLLRSNDLVHRWSDNSTEQEMQVENRLVDINSKRKEKLFYLRSVPDTYEYYDGKGGSGMYFQIFQLVSLKEQNDQMEEKTFAFEKLGISAEHIEKPPRECILGSGGFGEVLKSPNKIRLGNLSRRVVAFKKVNFIKWNAFSSKKRNKMIDDVRREIYLTSSLDYKHVLKTYGMCIDNPGIGPLLLMEFCHGGCLYTTLHKNPRSKEAKKILEDSIVKRIELLVDVADGLNYLHDCNLVHRDVKSQNTLLVVNGDDVVPKICDFGLTRQFHDYKTDVSLSKGAGTNLYWAPENRGARKARKNVDVFAFGIMAMETLKWEKPKPKPKNDAECTWLNRSPRLLSGYFGNTAREKKLAKQLEDCIRTMFDRDPEKRPAMAKVVKSLETILDSLE